MSLALMTAAFFVSLAAFADQVRRFQDECAARAIADWAAAERVVVLDAERRYLATGPFPTITAGDQPVYLLTVRTRAGERRVWVQCGELPWGVLSPTVAARWDD